jgi:hypothetical protein
MAFIHLRSATICSVNDNAFIAEEAIGAEMGLS